MANERKLYEHMPNGEMWGRLLEDVGSPEEAGQLLPVARRLERWPAPAPTPEETTRLIQALQPALTEQTAGRQVYAKLRRRVAEWWPWLLLCAQVRVVRQEIWVASSLVMTLGVIVTLATRGPAVSHETLTMVLIAPLVAAAGLAFIYGPGVDPALEIELATPTSPRLVLLARLVLVFGFDLVLGLVGSLALALLRPDISLWPLVMAWLAPMTFLSALSLLISVISSDPEAGALISLVLWAIQNVMRLFDSADRLFHFPSLMAAAARPWLWGLAFLMSGLALWLGAREEHWLGGRT
jgi:hypothetical protein